MNLKDRHEAHRAELPDIDGMKAYCCDGCALADELLDEVARLARERDEARSRAAEFTRKEGGS